MTLGSATLQWALDRETWTRRRLHAEVKMAAQLKPWGILISVLVKTSCD